MTNTNNNAILAALLALLTLAVGCGAGAASAPEGDRAEAGTAELDDSSLAGNFAGKVEGTDALVSMVVDRENHAVTYVCDGSEGEAADVAGWLRGAVKNTSTGFIDPLGDLSRPSRPVSGFVGSGLGL